MKTSPSSTTKLKNLHQYYYCARHLPLDALACTTVSCRHTPWPVPARSNETTFGVCNIAAICARLGAPMPVSIQNDFSLVARHFEEELAEASRHYSIREWRACMHQSAAECGGGRVAGAQMLLWVHACMYAASSASLRVPGRWQLPCMHACMQPNSTGACTRALPRRLIRIIPGLQRLIEPGACRELYSTYDLPSLLSLVRYCAFVA